jgi:hypothetical protein
MTFRAAHAIEQVEDRALTRPTCSLRRSAAAVVTRAAV